MATRDYSKKQEYTVANYLDGHTTPNSGATGFAKGDVLVYDTIVNVRQRQNQQQHIALRKNG